MVAGKDDGQLASRVGRSDLVIVRQSLTVADKQRAECFCFPFFAAPSPNRARGKKEKQIREQGSHVHVAFVMWPVSMERVLASATMHSINLSILVPNDICINTRVMWWHWSGGRPRMVVERPFSRRDKMKMSAV